MLLSAVRGGWNFKRPSNVRAAVQAEGRASTLNSVLGTDSVLHARPSGPAFVWGHWIPRPAPESPLFASRQVISSLPYGPFKIKIRKHLSCSYLAKDKEARHWGLKQMWIFDGQSWNYRAKSHASWGCVQIFAAPTGRKYVGSHVGNHLSAWTVW